MNNILVVNGREGHQGFARRLPQADVVARTKQGARLE
jgi:hypothetical protein